MPPEPLLLAQGICGIASALPSAYERREGHMPRRSCYATGAPSWRVRATRAHGRPMEYAALCQRTTGGRCPPNPFCWPREHAALLLRCHRPTNDGGLATQGICHAAAATPLACQAGGCAQRAHMVPQGICHAAPTKPPGVLYASIPLFLSSNIFSLAQSRNAPTACSSPKLGISAPNFKFTVAVPSTWTELEPSV